MEAVQEEQNEVAKRDDSIVKIDAKLAKMAKTVAEAEDKYMAEYLSELIRPQLEKDYKRVLKRLLKEMGES